MNEINKLMEELQMAKENTNQNNDKNEEKDEPMEHFVHTCNIPKTIKKNIRLQGEVNSVCYSYGGTYLAVGGNDKQVRLYDSVNGTLMNQLLGSERTIMNICFSYDDECVLATSNDFAARIWNISLGRIKHSLLGHTGKVFSSKFTSDNQKAVTGSHDRTIKVWDLQKGYCSSTIFCISSCNDLAVSRDTNLIVSGHLDNKLRFWDIKTEQCAFELGGIHSGQITSTCISLDCRVVLTNSRDNTLKLVDIRTYEVGQTFTHENFRNGINWSRACMSPDSSYVVAGSNDGQIYIWDVYTGKLDTILKKIHESTITCCAWVPNGSSLSSCDRTGNVVLWQ